MTTLSDLISRLERAECGDRELDFWISARVFDPCDYTDAELQADIDDVGIEGMHIDAAFTTSVDAAIALAEKILPRWSMSLGLNEGYKFPVVTMGRSYPTNKTVAVEHHTAPLAICLAILKALQQKENAE